MTEAEFNVYVARVTEELEAKQARLTKEYGLGQYKDYACDLATGLLQFKDAKGTVTVTAQITAIGSWRSEDGTWQWAWAKRQLPEARRASAERFKDIGDLTGMSVLGRPAFQADEQMTWELAAMAVDRLAALGCYHMPSRQVVIFVAIEQIQRAA